jgi:hypothetical protein
MSWHQEASKGVEDCDKLGVAVKQVEIFAREVLRVQTSYGFCHNFFVLAKAKHRDPMFGNLVKS